MTAATDFPSPLYGSIEHHPSDGAIQAVRHALIAYNIATAAIDESQDIAVCIHDAQRQLMGGIVGTLWGQCVEIAYLWVHHRLRGHGYGRSIAAVLHDLLEDTDWRREGAPVMKPRISMITLGVRDLAASVNFYEEGLGFPRMDSPPEVAFFTLNGTWLGLYGREALAADAMVPPGGSGFAGFALAHNVYSEAEVDDVMRQAIRAGATVVKEPRKVFWGGYSGYFTDPDGYLWEVACNPHFWVGPHDEGA